MRLDRLAALITVVDVGSISAAAKLLHIAQPALSRQLQQLEAEVGVTLLERHRTGVSPSPAAAVLVERSRALLADWDAALAETRRLGAGDRRRLRIGVWQYTAFAEIDRLHRWCAATYPDADVSLHTIAPEDPTEGITRSDLDLVFTRPPLRAGSGVASERVRTEPLLAALPTRHRLARARQVRLEDLVGEPWALYPRADDPEWVDGLLATCERVTGRRPQVRFVGTIALDNLPHVAQGTAVTVVSTSLAAMVTVAGVRYRPIVGQPLDVPLLMAWRAGDRDPLLAAARAEARRIFT